MKSRAEIIAYFEELCGPHLDPDIHSFTDADLQERYQLSQDDDLNGWEWEMEKERRNKMRKVKVTLEFETDADRSDIDIWWYQVKFQTESLEEKDFKVEMLTGKIQIEEKAKRMTWDEAITIILNDPKYKDKDVDWAVSQLDRVTSNTDEEAPLEEILKGEFGIKL